MADMPSSAPSFSVSGPSSVNEGDSASFSVSISGTISSPTTVYFSTLSGSASYPAGDYASATDRVVTFTPGGATTQTVTVPTLADNLVEGNETFKGVVYATSGTFSNGIFLATSNEVTLVDKTGAPTATGDIVNGSSILDAGNGTSSAYSLTGTSSITGSVGGSDSGDYYKFVAAGTGTGTFALTGLSQDVDLYLLNSSGSTISSSDASGSTSENISYSVTAGSTYYVKVNPYAPGVSNYSLSATLPSSTPTPPPTPTRTLTGQTVITTGEQHLGQNYFWAYDNHGTAATFPVAGATWVTMSNVALANPSYAGPWDCAEFVTYSVYQAYGLKYGLINKDTASQESSAGQWLTDATTMTSLFTEVTLSQARNTPGVILVAKSGGHVAISMGDGSHIIEANVDQSGTTYYSDGPNSSLSISHGATDGVAVNASLYDTNDDKNLTVGSDPPRGIDIGDVKISNFIWSSTNYRAFEIKVVNYGEAVTPTPTPNPTGDTPSGGRIFLEGKDAGSFFGAEYGHLYLVYQDSNGQEQVIRGGQAGGTWFDPFGPIIIEAGRPLSGSSDSRNGQSAADHGQTPIDLGDRLASDVWTIMVDFANDIGAQQIAYDIIPITNNSNTVAVSVLRAVGVPLPNPLPLASQLNYRGSDHLLGFDYSLAGTGHSDILVGYTGNDQLSGGAGNDTLNGGSGTDIAVFSGNLANYTLTKTGSTYTVRANTGTDGTDTVTNVESLKFADMAVNLTVQATAATVATADLHRLEELYVAFFNRVPDADGLAYWIGQFKAGSTINQIAESLYNIGASAQYSSLTGFSTSMSNTDFIHVFYKNVLGRPAGADSGGLSYWNDKLTDGSSTRYSLAQDILNSAHTLKGDTTYGSVADLLDNKIAVANKVAVDWGLNYNTDAYTHGVDIAKAVTATSTSAALTLVGISAAEMSLG